VQLQQSIVFGASGGSLIQNSGVALWPYLRPVFQL